MSDPFGINFRSKYSRRRSIIILKVEITLNDKNLEKYSLLRAARNKQFLIIDIYKR